jgi:TolB protein
VVDVRDPRTRQRLTNDSLAQYTPAWSPNGKRIAFAGRPKNGNYHIYVMNADGTNVRRLTPNDGAHDLSPAWSSDGSMIAFASDRGRSGGKYEIYAMTSEGTGMRRLTNVTALGYDAALEPSWQP